MTPEKLALKVRDLSSPPQGLRESTIIMNFGSVTMWRFCAARVCWKKANEKGLADAINGPGSSVVLYHKYILTPMRLRDSLLLEN